jgi:hypothetical protein
MTLFGAMSAVLVVVATPRPGEVWYPFHGGGEPGPARVDLLSANLSGCTVEVALPGIWVETVAEGTETYQRLRIASTGLTADIGYPELPYVGRWVGVPHGAEVRASITVLDSIDLQGYQIWPAQEPLPDVEDAEPRFQRNESFYAEGGRHPEHPLRVSGKHVIRGLETVLLGLFPLHYDASERRLRVYRQMRVELSFTGGAGYFVEKRLRSRFFEPLYAGILLNYGSLEDHQLLGLPRQGEGEMIILVPDDMESAVLPLSRWRTISGLPTVVTTLSNAGGNAAGIQQYVADAYGNWQTPPSFVLMVGDADLMPTNYLNSHPVHSYMTGSDLWYFTVDGNDDFADIHHGRLSVEDTTQLGWIVQKLIGYEKDPVPGPWNNRALLASYDQPTMFYAATSDSIYSYLASLGYDVDRAYYAGDPPGSTQDVVSLWSQGCFAINHRDHGVREGWKHPSFTISDLPQLTNGWRLPVVYNINCLAGYFDSETDGSAGAFESFCEELIRLPHNGAVGAVGATRVSWSGYNDELNFGIWDAMLPGFDPGYPGGSDNPWVSPTFRQGVVLDYAKWWMHDCFVVTGGNGYPDEWSPTPEKTVAQHEMYHYHGDPSQDIHSAEPSAIAVTHDSAAAVGVDTFFVYADAESSLAALSVEGHLIGREFVSGGVAQILIWDPPALPGIMDVVVTAHNHIPYEGTVGLASDSGWCVVVDSVFTDDYWGHSDGVIEQGDSVALTVCLWNLGPGQAPSVTGTLSSVDSAVVVCQDYRAYGDMPPGQKVSSPGAYLLAVAGGVPDGHIVPLNLAVTSGDSLWTRQFSMTVHAPVLRYLRLYVDDSGGNGDGHPDPGENVDLDLVLINDGSGTAAAVQADLSCASGLVSMTPGTVAYADMAPGDSMAQLTPLQVSFDQGIPQGTWIPFTLDVTAFGPYVAQLGFRMLVGRREVLFVDADSEPTEGNFIAALDASGYGYDLWETFEVSPIPSDTLRCYRVVVWTGGDENTYSMRYYDRVNMIQYLSHGGSLLFSAENYLTTHGSDSFTHAILRVAGYTTSVNVDTVRGVSGDPITDGMVMATDFPWGMSNYPDEIVPDAQATGILTVGASSDVTALRYPASGVGDHRVVFMATPFEALEPGVAYPDSPEIFLENCLYWLTHGPDTQPPSPVTDLRIRIWPSPDDVTMFWVEPWDDVGIEHYNIYRDTTAYFTHGAVTLLTTAVDTIWTDIGAAGALDTSHYYIVTAVDPSGNESSPSSTVGEMDYHSAAIIDPEGASVAQPQRGLRRRRKLTAYE